MYARTVRNMSCEIIMNGAKSPKCLQYRGTLRNIDGLHRRRCHQSDVLLVLAGLTSGCSTHLKNNNGIEIFKLVLLLLREN